LTPVVPSVQYFFAGVVIHHGVVAVLVCELYVGVPLFSCFGVISKVDGSGSGVIGVDTVDHSTGHKSIAHRSHWFYLKEKSVQWVERYVLTMSVNLIQQLLVNEQYQQDYFQETSLFGGSLLYESITEECNWSLPRNNSNST